MGQSFYIFHKLRLQVFLLAATDLAFIKLYKAGRKEEEASRSFSAVFW